MLCRTYIHEMLDCRLFMACGFQCDEEKEFGYIRPHYLQGGVKSDEYIGHGLNGRLPPWDEDDAGVT